MNKSTILFLLISTLLAYSEGFVSLHFGTSWPGTLEDIPKNEDKILYNIGCNWGGVGKSKVGVFGTFDILTKGTNEAVILSQKSSQTGGSFETFTEANRLRRRAASLGLGIIVTPLSNKTIRPVLKASFAPTVMLLFNDNDKIGSSLEAIPPTGAYWGSIKRTELEIHTMISETTSLFLSIGFQFGYLKKRINFEFFQDEREYIRQSMNGISLKVGFHFW